MSSITSLATARAQVARTFREQSARREDSRPAALCSSLRRIAMGISFRRLTTRSRSDSRIMHSRQETWSPPISSGSTLCCTDPSSKRVSPRISPVNSATRSRFAQIPKAGLPSLRIGIARWLLWAAGDHVERPRYMFDPIHFFPPRGVDRRQCLAPVSRHSPDEVTHVLPRDPRRRLARRRERINVVSV